MRTRLRRTPAGHPGRAVTSKTCEPLCLKRVLCREVGACVALALLALAAYAPCLHGEFVFDDNHLYVAQNPVVQADDGLYRIWCTTQPVDFYPLTHTTFWIEWRLWGGNTLGYHALNLFLHVVAAVLAWHLLRRLGMGTVAAWLAAAIFLLHPVNVQAVAWISQRKSLLATAFGFAALLCFCHYDSNRKRSWYVASLVLCALAHTGKSSMLMLPVVLAGYCLWQHGRLRRQDLFDLAPFFLLSLFFGLAGWWFMQHRGLEGKAMRHDNLFGRLATAGWALWFYWFKDLVPLRLTLIYPKWQVDPFSPIIYLPDLLLAAIALVCLYYRKSWGWPLLVGLGYFVITIFPALGFFDVGHFQFSLVADHYQHQSLIGLIALAVGAGAYLVKRYGRDVRLASVAVSGLVLIVLLGLTRQQAGIWATEESLWRDTIAKTPNATVGYWNLGRVMCRSQRYDEAIACLRKGIELYPYDAGPHNDLGFCWMKKGDFKQAEEYYRQAMQLDPSYASPYVNLGNLFRRSQPELATYLYRTAIEHDPWRSEPHNNLGAILEGSQPEEAQKEFLRALAIDPKYADAHNNFGSFLARRRQWDEAVAHFREAIRLKPDFIEAQRNLDMALKLARS